MKSLGIGRCFRSAAAVALFLLAVAAKTQQIDLRDNHTPLEADEHKHAHHHRHHDNDELGLNLDNDDQRVELHRREIASDYAPIDSTSQTSVWKHATALSDLPAAERCKTEIVLALGAKECEALTDDIRTKYAVLLYDCQLVALNRARLHCLPSMSNADCTKDFDHTQLNILLTLKASVAAHCHEAQQVLWHFLQKKTLFDLSESTHRAVHTLSSLEARHVELSDQTASLLAGVRTTQDEILQEQYNLKERLATAATLLDDKLVLALNNQDQLVENQLEALTNQRQLLDETQKTKTVLDDMNEDMARHHGLVVEFLRDVMRVLETIREFEEATGFAFDAALKILVYVLGFLVTFLLTSSKRTMSCRATMFGILLFQLTFELYIWPDSWIWVTRKAAMTLCMGVMAWTWLRHMDDAQHQIKSMGQLHRKIDHLLHLLATHQSQVANELSATNVSLYAGHRAMEDALDNDFDDIEGIDPGRDEDYYSDTEEYESDDPDELQQELAQLESFPTPTGLVKANYMLRPRRTTKRNPLLDVESPEEFFKAHQLWSLAQQTQAALESDASDTDER
eukprot:m.138185 g.138185  ORF g.138185 m.138185 type:complete len:568 (+) comp15910_c0_seq1:120-1823(+)